MTERIPIPALDEILNKKYQVLDHGFIALVNYMGADTEVCDAARTCMSGEGTKTVSDDRALVRRLMRDNHTSPFEFVEFTFLCQMPIFVARQWIRHRTANVNEMSGRYGELPELVYIPEAERIAWQNPVNKQGSGDAVGFETAKDVRAVMKAGAQSAFRDYHALLGQDVAGSMLDLTDSSAALALRLHGGISRELARINLPLSTYTKWKWKIDLHNLLHFLRLRLDPHAQWEIRQYAEVMAQVVRAGFPAVWEAFEDFKLNALTLSGPEVAALGYLQSLRTGTPAGSVHALRRMSGSEFNVFAQHLTQLHLDYLIVDATACRAEGA
jgi:thymidylate synthase (FAD)